MKIVSLQISRPGTILWRGKQVQTGIFKEPVEGPVKLLPEGVKGDLVVDRKHHGGWDMAFYVYPSEHYPFWRKKYLNKTLHFGMFGENLTTEGLIENQVRVGNIYRLGGGRVKAIQPRMPCYKLGAKFDDQKVVKEFVDAGFPGIYFQVLEPAIVEKGSRFDLENENQNAPLITEVYQLIYHFSEDEELINRVVNNVDLPQGLKEGIAEKQNRKKS